MPFNISQKWDHLLQSCTFCSAGSNGNRVQQKRRSFRPPRRIASRNCLTNKAWRTCSSSLNNSHLKVTLLLLLDACLIVKMILTAYENRYFKLTNCNKEIFQNDLQNHLSIQIEADKTGLHKNTFKEILYTMLKSKKRINLLEANNLVLDHSRFENQLRNADFLQPIFVPRSHGVL